MTGRPPRPAPADVAIVVTLLVLSWIMAAAPGLETHVRLGAAAVALAQTLPILLHRSRPVAAVLLFAATKPVQYALMLPVADVGWLVLAYLLVRHRTHRAVLLLGSTVALTAVATGIAWTVWVPAPSTVAGVALSVGSVLAPQVALAAALGWAVRAARERADRQRVLAEQARRACAVEAERLRITDELNGVVLDALRRLVQLSTGLRSRLAEPPPSAVEALAAVQAEARRVLAAMRRVLVLLRGDHEAVDPRPAGRGLRLRPPPAPTLDGLALALGFAALTLLVDALAPGVTGSPEVDRVAPLLQLDGRPLTVALIVAQLSALGWWRSAPLAALAAGTLGSVASAVHQSSHVVAEYSWVFLVYGAGAGAPAVVGALSVLAASATVLVTTLLVDLRLELGVAEYIGGYLVVPVVWAVAALRRGRILRTQRLAVDDTRAAVARERHRIARELHDVVAQHVSAIAVQAGAARSVASTDPAAPAAAAGHIETYGRRVGDAIPELVGLTPPSDAVTLTLAGVEELVEPLRAVGLPVVATVRGEPRPGGDVELFAQRILVEALRNVLRHAGPTATTVTMDHDAAAVRVAVRDVGPVDGHRPGEGTGLGLVGMRERVELLGGELRAGPDGPGWTVEARLPRAFAPTP